MSALAQNKIELPSEQNKKILFEQVVETLSRVDGDGLIPFLIGLHYFDLVLNILYLENVKALNPGN